MKPSDFDCEVVVTGIDEALGRQMELPKLQMVTVGRTAGRSWVEVWQMVKKAMISDLPRRVAWHQAAIDVECVADSHLYCSRHLCSELALSELVLHLWSWIELVWVLWTLTRTHHILAR